MIDAGFSHSKMYTGMEIYAGMKIHDYQYMLIKTQ